MIREVLTSTVLLGLCSLPSPCQDSQRVNVPIYRVTVIQRSVEAINYEYRAGPTQIDFLGTVLLPKAKGQAIVESRRGRTEIDAKLDNVEESQRFGREYLTYVLWAITPEGRPHNLGEIVPGPSNKAKLRVTTDLQAFGLIVTAEPYSAVRQPSDVVVMENRVRADTLGQVQQIHARYELLPRGQYTLEKSGGAELRAADTQKVSMDQYEAISQLYQARNAIGIARSAYAEQYAPNTFAKAQQLADKAEQLQRSKASASQVVQNAREAAQTAEDARVIAERRRQDEQLSRAQADVSAARQAKAQAEVETQQAKIEAEAARAQAESERTARQRAEADAATARQRAAAVQAASDLHRISTVPATSIGQQPDPAIRQKSELRMRLLERLNGAVATRDTPRGLVVILPDANFSGPVVLGMVRDRLARVSVIVAANPGLRVHVEGHTDSVSTEMLARQRAESVGAVLMGAGLPAAVVSAQGFGSARPLASNASAAGRAENRRVEIVITGDPIGNLPFWDRAYSLSMR